MAEYIVRNVSGDSIFYYSRFQALKVFVKAKGTISSKMLFLGISLFFSPFLFIILFCMAMEKFLVEIIYEFFYDKRKFTKYKKIMQPKSASRVLSVIGYQVFEEELEDHFALIGDRTEEGAKRLADKQKQMMREENSFRNVGFDKKLLTTHILLVGKTGSGKTEGIRSIADDVFKIGGGLLFNDGKSDETMLREFQLQAKRAGRETSTYVLNFLKPEKISESNTFSPLGIMHPVKIVEFFGSLIKDGGGGDGNSEYFFNRGKAMLFPVVNATYIRNKYFREGFSLEKIFENTTVLNIAILYISLYCMARDINENIKRSPRLSVALSTVATIVIEEDFKEIEKTIQYITENPTKQDMVKEAGLTFIELKELYSNSFLLIKGYLEKVWNQYGPILNNISGVIYKMSKQEGAYFFGEGAMSIIDIKKQYNVVKEVIIKKDEATAREFQRKYGLGQIELTTLVDAFNSQKGTLENPPADAIQQHSYAQQQFSVLEGLFTMYKHIFGQSKPEIRPDKLIRDNKFLYIVLPVLEMQAAQVKILGKMIIMTIKEVAAIALGGERLSQHKTLAAISKDRITPKPFTFVILDEYGAYPVDGIDTLLAQVRSLNISMAIAVQDYASLKAGGSDETSQQRALANTTKWLLKLEDEKAITWAKSMLVESKYETNDFDRDAYGDLSAKQEVKIETKRAFNVERLRDFDNGFSVLLMGSDSDGVVFLQTYYRGGTSDNISIKRYISMES